MQKISDAGLVRRAQVRQPDVAAGAEAIGELYDRHHQRIFRYIWARVTDRQLAEDLTGEVFARMIASLPGYRPGKAPFQAWLYRIAHNLLIDHYRREGNQAAFPLDRAERLEGETDDPSEVVIERLSIEQVRRALQSLDPDQQEVIILRFLIGLSLREVATLLRKTVGTVKIIQHRGLKALRAVLKSESGEKKK